MTDKTPAITAPNSDYLVRGSDFLARKPEFKLLGRDEELKEVANVLMRKDTSNLILAGAAGVGVSSVVMGLQASKDDLNTPFDIVGKRFFWLDTDGLFGSGDTAKITEGFQKALSTLSRLPDTVLVIEDSGDFFDAASKSGCTHLINALMRETRNGKFQLILESRDTDLAKVIGAHSDMRENFTLMEIREPEKVALKAMLEGGAKGLEAHHGIKISEDAVKSAMDLTGKYYIKELDSAQPKRSFMLLEGALTALRHKAHARPMELDVLEAQKHDIDAALAGKGGPGYAGKSPAELEAIRLETENRIREVTETFAEQQKQMRKFYADQRKAEEAIRDLEAKIDEEKKVQAEAAKLAEQEIAAGREVQATPASKGLGLKMSKAGFETESITRMREELKLWQQAVDENKAKYSSLAATMNEGLELKAENVMAEFSRLSGVPVSRLGQDETTKLLKLEETLGKRVVGQDEPLEAVAKSVRRGRTGLKKATKPIGSFLFLGPSGVGKTELAKALAEALFGDESALKRYDMSEYQEKHAVAKLIGAPPGYEGYADGGILTNAMRRQPYCVNVFDEIEKGHKDVYDLFLQIIDDGRLTDSRGLTASFANSINIMTSNIGAEHFLDESLTFEEAKEKALAVLWNPDKEKGGSGYRPEFLNRFTGIYCFNRLGLPQIELIAGRGIKEINGWIAEQGLEVIMSEEDRKAMCADHYVPRGGARSILGYIEKNITSDVSDSILRNPDHTGVIQVTYDRESKKAITKFLTKEDLAGNTGPANENRTVSGAAQSAFKAAK